MSGGGRDKTWLEANLPHAGAMNLLDRVVRWNETTLAARATGHRAPGHPLRRGGMLPIAAAIEYGAQAAAAHGALAEGAPSGTGFLAAMRSVAFHAERLDDVEGELDIAAEQVGAGAAGVLYAFQVSGGGKLLAEGCVTVAFAR